MSQKSSAPAARAAAPPPPGRILASRRRRVVRLRLRDREFNDWRTRARRADVTLSEWLRKAAELMIQHEDATVTS